MPRADQHSWHTKQCSNRRHVSAIQCGGDCTCISWVGVADIFGSLTSERRLRLIDGFKQLVS